MIPFHRIILIASLLGAAAGLFVVRGRRRLLLAISVVPVGYVAALHIVMPAEPRFNIPVMPLLITCGAVGAATLARRAFLDRRQTHRPSPSPHEQTRSAGALSADS
jgi:hypothetical protein